MAERLTPRTPGFKPLLSSIRKKLYSTLSFFTQMCKWELATYCWGVILGVVAILLSMLHAKETGITFGPLGFWIVCAFTV